MRLANLAVIILTAAVFGFCSALAFASITEGRDPAVFLVAALLNAFACAANVACGIRLSLNDARSNLTAP